MSMKACYRCGCPNDARIDWCHDCGALMPERPAPASAGVWLVRVLIGFAFVLVGLVVITLMSGCAGAPFTSSEALEISNAGAGGYTLTMSQAGAGGRDDERCDDDTRADPHDDAGSKAGTAGSASMGGRRCDQGSAGGVDDGPGNGTAGAGSDAGHGGTSGACGGSACAGRAGMGTGGSSGGAASAASGGSGEPGGAGGSVGACLVGWQGSTCDVCSTADAPSSGRSCADVLDCYGDHAQPWTGCDYSTATQDLQVELAHAVAECRCGALR